MRTTSITTLFALVTLMATTIFASGFSLISLEPLQKSEVTPGCYAAYTAEITGCSEGTSTCTSICITSIAAATKLIQSQCEGAFTSVGSVLRRTIDGGLLTLVCRNSVSEVAIMSTIYLHVTSALQTASALHTALETELVIDTRIPTMTGVRSGAVATGTDRPAVTTTGGAVASGVGGNSGAGMLTVGPWVVVGVAAALGAGLML